MSDKMLRLLGEIKRGTFDLSKPSDDLRDDITVAGHKNLFSSDGDDVWLTEAGELEFARLQEGPDYWAWPFTPLQRGTLPHCRNAQAKKTLTPGWNLEQYRLRLQWLTALPNPGEDFGVICHDNNPTQQQLGYGWRYYAPTLEDYSIVQELFPSGNPGNPLWNQVEAELILAGHAKKELRNHSAATLIRQLRDVRHGKKAVQANPQTPSIPAEHGDPSQCPECKWPVPSAYETLSKLTCQDCGRWELQTGVFVSPAAGPQGTPPSVVRLHAPLWRPLPLPGSASVKAQSPKKKTPMRKTTRKTRKRVPRTVELLLAFLPQDDRHLEMNLSELAEAIEVSVSSVSRAFRHRTYGQQLTKMYLDARRSPPRIRDV